MRLILLVAALSSILAAGRANAQIDGGVAEFKPCEVGAEARAGSLCAVARAPLRYDGTATETVDLFIRRFPALGVSRGDVWLVAGGPGESGAGFHAVLDTLRAAFPDHDLIMPDHRGTGRSSRVCPEEEATGSPGGVALEGAEWGTCFGALQARTPWVQSFTISNAARDLSGLIAGVSGARETYVYGVSYGTQLVLRMMTVAPPASAKGIVLDSLVPPETARMWGLSHRSKVTDEIGRAVLADCDADAACGTRFGGSAADALRAVIDDPDASKRFPGGPKGFLSSMLDSPDARALIPDVILDARSGRTQAISEATARLERFYAPFTTADAGSSIPLVALISASENNARPDLTAEDVEAEAEDLLFTSPIPGQLVGGAGMAYPRDAAFGVVPAGLPPVLVLHGDRDPKTPHVGALAHASLLQQAGTVQFVTVAGAPHYILLTAPTCAVASIQTFVAGDVESGQRRCE